MKCPTALLTIRLGLILSIVTLSNYCENTIVVKIIFALQSVCPGPSNTLGDPSGMYWSPITQGDLTWNFEKFLIDKTGRPYKRYTPNTEPMTLGADIAYLQSL